MPRLSGLHLLGAVALLLCSCTGPGDVPARANDGLSGEEVALCEPGDLILRRSKGVTGLLIPLVWSAWGGVARPVDANSSR